MNKESTGDTPDSFMSHDECLVRYVSDLEVFVALLEAMRERGRASSSLLDLLDQVRQSVEEKARTRVFCISRFCEDDAITFRLHDDVVIVSKVNETSSSVGSSQCALN